jgi:hypothetical protein
MRPALLRRTLVHHNLSELDEAGIYTFLINISF